MMNSLLKVWEAILVAWDDESENVTGMFYFYQLLIFLFNLEISIEMPFEKLTWLSIPDSQQFMY